MKKLAVLTAICAVITNIHAASSWSSWWGTAAQNLGTACTQWVVKNPWKTAAGLGATAGIIYVHNRYYAAKDKAITPPAFETPVQTNHNACKPSETASSYHATPIPASPTIKMQPPLATSTYNLTDTLMYMKPVARTLFMHEHAYVQAFENKLADEQYNLAYANRPITKEEAYAIALTALRDIASIKNIDDTTIADVLRNQIADVQVRTIANKTLLALHARDVATKNR